MYEPEQAFLMGNLTTLQAQLQGMQSMLRRRLEGGAQERSSRGLQMEALLLQANEQLVLSALQAHAAAQSAISHLDQLTRTSQRDELTNVPTRTILLDRLGSALAMAQRRGTAGAVVFVDVDHFKRYNDTMGHATGDAVLQHVARVLQGAVRDSDAVGRHGGDEFLVLLSEVSKTRDVAQIAKDILCEVARPCVINGHELQVTVSVGVALYPHDAQDAATLIALADSAMYRSKALGGGSASFHGQQHAAWSLRER